MDASEFEVLVSPYRRELAGHCYRMTGSLSDAEDALQDAMVRAWRGMTGFEGRASLRTWLYKISTNACIDLLSRKPARTIPAELGPPAGPDSGVAPPRLEPIWLEPCPESFWQAIPAGPDARFDAKESVTVAFLVALQALPALQRAVLLLRDVVGWSAAETAEMLETTPAAVNSALQRARATLEARADRFEPMPVDATTRALLQKYLATWESGDMNAFAALLRDEATLQMPPVPTWARGRDAIAALLGALAPHFGAFRGEIVPACGGLAIALYERRPGTDRFVAQSIHVPRFEGGLVKETHVFMDTSLFARFGLAEKL